MKATTTGSGTIETGFKRAEDGWHVVVVCDGIDILKNKEGKTSTTKGGDQMWKIPLKINDETDISHDVEVDAIAAENARGEQLITDFLGATNLFEEFAKRFPDTNVSVFEPKIMDKVKVKLNGQFFRIKTKQNAYKDKDGKEQIAVNIVAFGKMSEKIEDLEAKLFPEKKGAAAIGQAATGAVATAMGAPAGATAAAKPADDGW